MPMPPMPMKYTFFICRAVCKLPLQCPLRRPCAPEELYSPPSTLFSRGRGRALSPRPSSFPSPRNPLQVWRHPCGPGPLRCGSDGPRPRWGTVRVSRPSLAAQSSDTELAPEREMTTSAMAYARSILPMKSECLTKSRGRLLRTSSMNASTWGLYILPHCHSTSTSSPPGHPSRIQAFIASLRVLLPRLPPTMSMCFLSGSIP